MAQRAEYVALRDIEYNGVWAFREGDPVPVGPAENLNLVIGEDVAPSGLALMPKPARNASRAAWAAYAVDQGAKQDDVDSMTRDELAAQFEEPTPESPRPTRGSPRRPSERSVAQRPEGCRRVRGDPGAHRCRHPPGTGRRTCRVVIELQRRRDVPIIYASTTATMRLLQVGQTLEGIDDPPACTAPERRTQV